MFYKNYQVSLQQNLGTQGHNMRNKFNLHTHAAVVPCCVREARQTWAFNLFNKLPVQIKQLDKYKSFKREVKTFLLNISLYV